MAMSSSIRLPGNVFGPLDRLSVSSERPGTYVIKKAVENYLQEYDDYQEDVIDTASEIIA